MSLNLELHSKELLLYPVLHKLDEGVLITDTALKIVFFNASAEKVFGLEAEQVLGQHVDTLNYDLKLASMLKKRQHFKQDKELINGFEIATTRGLLEIGPDAFACYVIFRTIDSFKENQLHSLLESPYEGIAIFDQDYRPVYVNDVCSSFLKCHTMDQLHNELLSLIPRTNLEESMIKSKPLSGEIFIQGRAVELIYLPLVRNNLAVGVIVKSSLSSREERTWWHLAEQYNLGTASYYSNHIVGNSNKITEQKELATRAARTVSTVLITGESGTGKEIFAHAIHNMSPRRKGPFIKVNCAAVPETLLESELFGYAEGAFTGALKEGKPGKFELANHGTIFLDEIADMTLAMQAKLLRVLQEKEIERIGSIHTTKVNVRVIAATNQNLPELVAENKFREDLFYRLNVIILDLPPLRDRKEDIPLISNTLLQRLNRLLGTRVDKISPEVMNCFCSYDWPGNIRELENTIERAINFCEGNVITSEHIPEHILMSNKGLRLTVPRSGTLENLLEQHEKQVILDTLKTCQGNKSKAAKTLNIHRSVLYRKLNKYNISI